MLQQFIDLLLFFIFDNMNVSSYTVARKQVVVVAILVVS